MHIGKSIKMALIKRGKDQKWLKSQLKSPSQQHVSRLANKQSGKSQTIEQLAEVFEMSTSEFIALGEE